jgi:hypothetical protein
MWGLRRWCAWCEGIQAGYRIEVGGASIVGRDWRDLEVFANIRWEEEQL